jgi:hypothetical protein
MPEQRATSSRNDRATSSESARNGTLRLGEAYDRYMLSEEELSGWEAAFDQDGVAGLQVKRLVR